MDKHRTPRAHAEPAPRHGARTAALQAGGEAEHDALAASPRSAAQRQRIAAAFGPVLQRTVASAAQALVDEGNTDKMKLAAFIKWLRVKVGSGQAKQVNSALHAVAADDFAAVMLAITGIKNAGAAQKKLDATQKVLDQALKEAQVTPSGGVSLTVGTVTGYLDADQLPHQAKGIAIGTRTANKKADSRFGSYADAAWHRANTLVTMTGWAAGLTLADGDTQATGQASARDDNIHYEGMALRMAGNTTVFFHCYPGADFKYTG